MPPSLTGKVHVPCHCCTENETAIGLLWLCDHSLITAATAQHLPKLTYLFPVT